MPREAAHGKRWPITGLISDVPGICDQWAPDLNEGLLASQVKASSPLSRKWRCLAHVGLGHDHIFEATVVHRTTSRPPCPMCARSKPCPTYNFAFLFPALAADWHYPDNQSKKRPD